MKIKLGILSIMLCLFGFSEDSKATKPCFELTKEEFQKRVLDKSDVIVIGKIIDYSQLENEGWTDIEFVKVLSSGRTAHAPETSKARINNWQANNFPVTDSNRGDELIFFLTKEKEHYILTDNDWVACQPSNWWIINNETYNRYKIVHSKDTYARITIDELSSAIENYYKAKK